MFRTRKPVNDLTFYERVIKYSLIWTAVVATVGFGAFLYGHFSEPIVVETQVIQYLPGETIRVGERVIVEAGLGDLYNGQVVMWNDIELCVSSIQTQNLSRSTAEGKPPIVINLRNLGQC